MARAAAFLSFGDELFLSFGDELQPAMLDLPYGRTYVRGPQKTGAQ
jgi:hypothetical protein